MTSRAQPSVRRLLERSIDSFEKLELVLVLFRAAAPSTIAELARTCELETSEARQLTNELSRSGLVTVETAEAGSMAGDGELVRLTPKDEDGAALNALAKLYDEDRALVFKTLSSIAMDKIRGMAARTFADAFQLRKRRDGDDG